MGHALLRPHPDRASRRVTGTKPVSTLQTALCRASGPGQGSRGGGECGARHQASPGSHLTHRHPARWRGDARPVKPSSPHHNTTTTTTLSKVEYIVEFIEKGKRRTLTRAAAALPPIHTNAPLSPLLCPNAPLLTP
ncbi:hypothetical protein O3P69_009626 [Scylla paramamosain]|uniref:HTH psq-type domain-containing protein n=1 Tax=Scylla paramamosain TaxID=85552 RepID=A0AAW0SUP9_SCYPA